MSLKTNVNQIIEIIKKEQSNPYVIFMCGVSGSGKSTVAHELAQHLCLEITGFDTELMNIATEKGMTYNQAWDRRIGSAHINTEARFMFWACNEENFILDQTSLTTQSRKKWLDKLFLPYQAICVCVETPNDTEHARRLAFRTSKHIPEKVIKKQKERFSMPTASEGFKHIFIVKNSQEANYNQEEKF